MSVIIAGQPELISHLNDESLRHSSSGSRCGASSPLTLQETAVYIAGRSGGRRRRARVFTREAVELIHERSRGIPRTISVIADNALLGGFAAGQRPVTSQVVRDVCRDFDIKAPSETGRPLTNGHTADGAERILNVGPRHVEDPSKKPVPTELFEGFAAKRKRFSFFGN